MSGKAILRSVRCLMVGTMTVVMMGGAIHASPIASDSFLIGDGHYTAGDRMGDAAGSPTGLSGDWSKRVGAVAGNVDLRITEAGLTHPGAHATGGAVESYRDGTAAHGDPVTYDTAFLNDPQIGPGQDVYFSVLLNLNEGVAGGVGIEFGNRDPFGVGIDENGRGFIYLVSSDTEFTSLAQTTDTFAAATTYLVVGKMVGVSGGNSANPETIELMGIYAAGDALVEPASPLLSASADVYFPADASNAPGNTIGQTLTTAMLLLSKSTGGVAGTADELRIGTSFEDVVVIPEPGSMTLLGAGLASLLWRRSADGAAR